MHTRPPRYPQAIPDCAFKDSFRTEGLARRAIRLSQARGAGLLRPFRCGVCRRFHLTSQPQRRPDVMEDKGWTDWN